MTSTPAAELSQFYEGPFQAMLEGEWGSWRNQYVEQVRAVRDANKVTWEQPEFQERLWDDKAISSVGPGQSVTLVEAYRDIELATVLREGKSSLEGLSLDQRGALLETLYKNVIDHVYPRYTPRRPKARLIRLLAAMFPAEMTCLMDASRVWSVQRLVGAKRLPGDFVAQHPSIKSRLREVLGTPSTLEHEVEQSMFAWYLWQEVADRPDEGAIPSQSADQANSVPPFSLLPANAQRRSLACVKDNVALLMAMVREAEQGISREDLVGVILSEATQLNASSAGNMISQAMGGLGLIRLDGNTYRPTERGLEMITAAEPTHVLRGPLVGRVFGMGHLLRMVQREPGKLRSTDVATKIRDLVPTWTSTQPGSYIYAWAKIAGLIQVEDGLGGRISLTEDGEEYVAALPDDFEKRWSIEPEATEQIDASVAGMTEAKMPVEAYGVTEIVSDGCFLDEQTIKGAVSLLRRKKNVVLQGPPGTGKTWLAKRLGYALLGVQDPSRLTAVQFQPSLSYEDFVRGWRPDGAGGLKLADGAFLDAISAAQEDPSRPFVFVIEEMNRGNPAQILGEMLTLIEDSKRNSQEALRLAYPRSLEERIYVPSNLFLIGTMNLADRSLALVDLALRRRFAFLTLKPLLNDQWRAWCAEMGCPPPLLDIFAYRIGVLNEVISDDQSLGDQFQVGHSFVTPIETPGPTDDDWWQWFLSSVETEIGPLLFEYWYDRPAEANTQIQMLSAKP